MHLAENLRGLPAKFTRSCIGMSPERRGAVVKEILSYFLRNPQAADSLEGIVRWRLLDQMIYRNTEETTQALEWLTEHGFLLKASRLGSSAIFRLNQEERSRAESFVGRAGRAKPHE